MGQLTHTRDTGSRLSHAGWTPPPSPRLLEIKRQRARPDVAVVASTNLKSCPFSRILEKGHSSGALARDQESNSPDRARERDQLLVWWTPPQQSPAGSPPTPRTPSRAVCTCVLRIQTGPAARMHTRVVSRDPHTHTGGSARIQVLRFVVPRPTSHHTTPFT